MKKAIVTGANGFIGHHFVEVLSKMNYDVFAVIRDKQEDISNIVNFDNVHIVYCDLEEISCLPQRIACDVSDGIFYHLAWAGSSGTARSDYELQLMNARYSIKAAEVASVMKCKRIVYAGSVTQLMYRDYLRNDNIEPELVTCYAIGKMVTEAMIKCICPSVGIEWNWTYISNFYGVDDPTENFINFLIKNYKNGIVPALTPATQMADFMYVTDVARALLAVGEKGKACSSYYIGYGEPKPLSTFINEIRDYVNPGIDSGIGRKPFNGMNVDFDSVNYKKLEQDTGFIPSISFSEGIRMLKI